MHKVVKYFKKNRDKIHNRIVAIIPIIEYNILIMEYLTAAELSKLWNISTRGIGVLCTQGRVEAALKKGKMWLIPDTAQKPADARYKKNKHNA